LDFLNFEGKDIYPDEVSKFINLNFYHISLKYFDLHIVIFRKTTEY